MNTLEIIGLLSLLVWVPTGVVVVVLLIFENTVSPATFGAFLRWYWRDRHKEDQKP